MSMPDNRFWRDATNRLVFEMSQMPARHYAEVVNDLVEVFGLVPDNNGVVIFLEAAFQNFRRGDAIVGLEWDIWSGFIVVANDIAAEGLVSEIADYMSASRWATIHLSHPEAS
jgi:hypothetical protein